MGGKLFSEQGGVRVSTAELEKVKTKVAELLQLIGVDASFPKDIASKLDHGDLDVVISAENGLEVVSRIEGYLLEHNYTFSTNGKVVSFLMDNFQVDLIVIEGMAAAEFAVKYYSYGDLANLAGYYAREKGMRLGFHGLYTEDNIPNVGIQKTYVTQNWDEALSMLGLSSERFDEGFESLEDVFTFIKSSSLFSLEVFAIEKLKSSQRRRIRKRPSQRAFFKELGLID